MVNNFKAFLAGAYELSGSEDFGWNHSWIVNGIPKMTINDNSSS